MVVPESWSFYIIANPEKHDFIRICSDTRNKILKEKIMKREQKRLGNKGFSLVELIVVIAIMAVLVVVLAPTLIGKIEESREGTDFDTLGQVRTQVVNALADEDIYKEVVPATGSAVYKIEQNECKVTLISGDGITVSGKLEAELQEVLGSYELQSKNADGGNIFVTITENGKVSAIISTDDNGKSAAKNSDGDTFEVK